MNIFYLCKTFGKAMHDFILFYLFIFYFWSGGLLTAYNSFLSPTTAKESYHDVKRYINRLHCILNLAMKSKLL